MKSFRLAGGRRPSPIAAAWDHWTRRIRFRQRQHASVRDPSPFGRGLGGGNISSSSNQPLADAIRRSPSSSSSGTTDNVMARPFPLVLARANWRQWLAAIVAAGVLFLWAWATSTVHGQAPPGGPVEMPYA